MPDYTSGTLTATAGHHATITATATRGITSAHRGGLAAMPTGVLAFIMVPGDGIHRGIRTCTTHGMLPTGTPGTALTAGTLPTVGIAIRLTAGTVHSDTVRTITSYTTITT